MGNDVRASFVISQRKWRAFDAHHNFQNFQKFSTFQNFKIFESFENLKTLKLKILKILMRVLYAFFPEIFSGTLTNDARASNPTKNWSHKSARHLPMTRARAKCAFFPEIFSGTLTNDARAFDARRYAYFTIGQIILTSAELYSTWGKVYEKIFPFGTYWKSERSLDRVFYRFQCLFAD